MSDDSGSGLWDVVIVGAGPAGLAAARAGLADLKAVDGISDALAESIYRFFHSGD